MEGSTGKCRKMWAKCGEMGKYQEVQGLLNYLRLLRSHLKIRGTRVCLEGAQDSRTSRSMILLGTRDRSKNLRESRKITLEPHT